MNNEQIFQEMKELEEKKPEEALLIVHKNYYLWRSTRTKEMKQEGCRDL